MPWDFPSAYGTYATYMWSDCARKGGGSGITHAGLLTDSAKRAEGDRDERARLATYNGC